MYISFGFIVLALTSALWRTHHLFEAAFQWERHQIAADNAAILLGQGDRKLFNWLAEQNRKMQRYESVYHAVHDKLIVLKMHMLRAEVEVELAKEWAATFTSAQAELKRFQVPLGRIQRPFRVPIHRQPCAVCLGTVQWRLPISQTYSVIVTDKIKSTVQLRLIDDWNYRLRDDEV